MKINFPKQVLSTYRSHGAQIPGWTCQGTVPRFSLIPKSSAHCTCGIKQCKKEFQEGERGLQWPPAKHKNPWILFFENVVQSLRHAGIKETLRLYWDTHGCAEETVENASLCGNFQNSLPIKVKITTSKCLGSYLWLN